MINKNVAELLNAQIGHELGASQQYLAIASYFASQGLDAWGDFFFKQSDEERSHALKISRSLGAPGTPFDFPALPSHQPHFDSALEVVEKSLSWEQEVTRSFHKMAEVALAEKDFTSFQFLQWFIEEQVEEEASIGRLVDLIRSGINLFQAEPLLSRDDP